MSDKNGGAAFPSPGVVMSDGRGDEMQQGAYEGMTLRDYFAAKALAGFSVELSKVDASKLDALIPGIASVSYAVADAMLKERTK